MNKDIMFELLEDNWDTVTLKWDKSERPSLTPELQRDLLARALAIACKHLNTGLPCEAMGPDYAFMSANNQCYDGNVDCDCTTCRFNWCIYQAILEWKQEYLESK